MARKHADDVGLEREHMVLVVERHGWGTDLIILLVFDAPVLLLFEVDDPTLDICRHSALRW